MAAKTKPPAFPARWNVSQPELIAETFSSRIWKVRRADGSVAVVKALNLFDDVWDEQRGAYFLRWRRGEGAVRLYGVEKRKMLLEYAGKKLLTQQLDEFGDDAATDIAADVLQRLFSPSSHPFPSQLQPLRERFAALFAKAREDRKAGTNSIYVEAAELADSMLDNPVALKPLHCDLHHDNILLGDRGWLAIDPKGVLGDPGFDAANLFYNPIGREALCANPERIAHMAVTFAKALAQTPAAILDHAFTYGCLSASWHAEDENDEDEGLELRIAEAIRKVRLSF